MINKVIILNPSMIVTCASKEPKKGKMMSELGIIYNKSVLIEDSIIKEINDTEKILKYCDENTQVFDCKNKCLLPGFIDSHTHLPFVGFREKEFAMRMSGMTYNQIMESGGGIGVTVEKTRSASIDELIQNTLPILNSMLSFGVTTIEAKSGYGLDIENELKQLHTIKLLNSIHDIDIVPTFLGAHDMPKDYKGSKRQYLDYMSSMFDIIKEENLADFVDIFIEKNVFSREEGKAYLEKAKEKGLKIKIHADELCNLETASLAGELKAVSADHLIFASDKGIESLASNNVIACLLPLTCFNLKEKYVDGRKLLESGCALAIATDCNPGSSFSENIALAVLLAVLHMGLTIEEAINCITINAAFAIGKGDTKGTIEEGKIADLVVLDYPSYEFIPYHLGTSSVNTVFKNGKIVYKKEK